MVNERDPSHPRRLGGQTSLRSREPGPLFLEVLVTTVRGQSNSTCPFPPIVTRLGFDTTDFQRRHLISGMMSYHTLGLVRLIAHGVPPFRFRPATIVSVRDFWSPPVSHGAFQLARSSPRAINTKQKRDEDKPVVHFTHSLRTLLSSAITTYGSAEVALLQIMKTHDFSPSLLQWVLTGLSILF